MQNFASLILFTILLTAFALKSIRYSSATPTGQNQSVEHKISGFMAHHGWHLSQMPGHSGQALFKSMTYTNPNCHQRITIGIMDANRELHNYVISALGKDLAILENNRFSTTRNVQHFGLNHASTTTIALLRDPDYAPLPPLAISPAPIGTKDTTDNNSACDTPKTEHWLNWSRNWH